MSEASLSPRPDRQEGESSLLQYPATFNFSDGVFEDEAKTEQKDPHPKRLSHSYTYSVLEFMKNVIKCTQFTFKGVMMFESDSLRETPLNSFLWLYNHIFTILPKID